MPGSPIEALLLRASAKRDEIRYFESMVIAHAARDSSELPKILRQLMGKLFPSVGEEEEGKEATLSHVLENWDKATESAMSKLQEQVQRNAEKKG